MLRSEKPATLTPRENQVMEHILKGASIKQIAVALDLSLRVVKFHVDNILKKKGAHSRMELLARHKAGDPGKESAG